MRAPINSEKHIVQNSLATVVAGVVSTIILAKAVDIPGATNTDVRVGSIIKFLHVEEWVRSQEVSPGSFVWIIAKMESGISNPGAATMANLNDWSNKKNIFHTRMGLTNDANADAMPLGTDIKIPKGKQRMGLNDQWVIVRFAQALDSNYCGKVIFKEYF